MIPELSRLLKGKEIIHAKNSKLALKVFVEDVFGLDRYLSHNFSRQLATVKLPGVDDHLVIKEFSGDKWVMCRSITHAKRICGVHAELYDYRSQLDIMKKSLPIISDNSSFSRFNNIVSYDAGQRSILTATHDSCLFDDYDVHIAYNLGLSNPLDGHKILDIMLFDRYIKHTYSLISDKPFYVLKQDFHVKEKFNINDIEKVKKLFGVDWLELNPYFVKNIRDLNVKEALSNLSKASKVHVALKCLGSEGDISNDFLLKCLSDML